MFGVKVGLDFEADLAFFHVTGSIIDSANGSLKNTVVTWSGNYLWRRV